MTAAQSPSWGLVLVNASLAQGMEDSLSRGNCVFLAARTRLGMEPAHCGMGKVLSYKDSGAAVK